MILWNSDVIFFNVYLVKLPFLADAHKALLHKLEYGEERHDLRLVVWVVFHQVRKFHLYLAEDTVFERLDHLLE